MTPYMEMKEKAERLEKALRDLFQFSTVQICHHDETYRGGVLWEICDQCGEMWADDKGGKPEFKWPEPIQNAESILNEK